MLHKKISNGLVGIGGMKCYCCAPQGSKARNELKRKMNKRVRKELDEEQSIEEGEFFNYWSQLDPSDVTGESAMGEMDYVIERDVLRELGPIYVSNFKEKRA